MALPLLQSGGGGGGGTTVNTKAKVTSNWLDSFTSGTGNFTASRPALSDLSDTPTQNLVVASPNGSTGAVTARALVNADLPTLFPTAGVGFFWAGTGPSYPLTNATSTVVTVANQVRVVQTVVPYSITVRKITIGVATLNAAQTGSVGIYDSSGNRLVDSGTFSLAAVATLTNTLGSPVTLAPGVYYIAYSQTDATTAKIQTQNNPAVFQPLFTNSVPRMGTAANNVSGGVMPATLGVVTAASNFIPAVLFES